MTFVLNSRSADRVQYDVYDDQRWLGLVTGAIERLVIPIPHSRLIRRGKRRRFWRAQSPAEHIRITFDTRKAAAAYLLEATP